MQMRRGPQVVVSARRGVITHSRPERFTVPKKIEVEMAVTKNCIGYEVQKFVPDAGWMTASPVVQSREVAELLMEEMQSRSSNESEFRVYEALDFPVGSRNAQSAGIRL